jgi:glycosyltransferase involved in cell wall biosynthesis
MASEAWHFVTSKMKRKKYEDFRGRHCMIVHAYYPLGETRVQREAEALLKDNYEVDVICLRKQNEPAIDEFKRVHIYRLPVWRHLGSGVVVQFLEYLVFFFLAMVKVSWLHWHRRYNTVQVHNLPDFLVFAAWIPRLLGARIILDLHDLMPEFYMARLGQDFKSLPLRLVRLQESLSCRFAHHVITVSDHWRQTLADRGVAPNKISVLMNVADDNIFQPPATRPRQTQTDGSLRLIYHGTVTQRYGLDLVLHAIARLHREAPDIHMTILGWGREMQTLISLVDELGLNDQVTIHWEVRPAEELPKIILTADAGVVPYRNDPFTDGLIPTKLLEYAALGLPSVAARTTAIAKYFDETMVEFFAPGSVESLVRSIMRLYTERTRLAELGQGIQRFNERFNWTKLSAEYVALVEALRQL